MLGSRIKRLAELERQIGATHKQATEQRRDAIWEQLSDAEQEAVLASMERRKQAGYVLTAEDHALEQRWNEAVQAAVPEDQRWAAEWRIWALAWCEAVKSHA